MDLTYTPDVYQGKDPFIHVSFHQNDRARVLSVLEKLDLRGFRFWLNDGISPGMETDEIIAEHIEQCDFFVAFLSGDYLSFLDTVDELNYSRDVNKDYLLIYLDDVTLPVGLDMRFMRAQSVKAYAMSDEEVFSRLLNIDGANRFFGIADQKLHSTAQKVFEKLEQLYPEHKVFALNAVNKQLSEALSALYVEAGYPSADRLMLDYGFCHISTEEARSLRSSVLYHPGFEPETVKPRVSYIMDILAEDYPDRVITDNLSKSHRSIYSSLLGLSVWLGYGSVAQMLEAYGYTGVSSQAGRTENDWQAILEQLQKRYEGKGKPTGLSKLLQDNIDMKAGIKTLTNRSRELFGMTLLQYLKAIGLIVPAEKEERSSQQAQTRAEIVAEIKAFYEQGCGSFADIEETLRQIRIKKNKAGQLYVTDCSACGETVQIPYGIDFIYKEAFSGQSDMVTLILPPTVREIREAAFADCAGLENIVFSEGLERIDNGAFMGCTSLKKIELPKSLKAIGNEAFSGCEELADVVFGNLRVNVQEDAFDDCIYELESLQDEAASPADYFELKVDKKNNARIIGYTGDEEVVVVPSAIGGHPILSIEKGSFTGNSDIREVYISDQISAINGDAFKDCTNLEKIHIPEAVSTLMGTTFAGCTNLTEINIPDAMEEVKRGCFKDAPLTTLYVGKSVKRISPDAFYKGEADFATGMYMKKKTLENLIVDANNENFSAEGTMLLSRDGKLLIAELGDPVQAVIPEGVEEIGPQAYDRLGSLCEVHFPSTLKKIGEKAFANCTNLKSVELPASLEVIDTQAFSFCRGLCALEFNEGLRVIGQQAFEGCPIADVFIPASVEFLGSDSFRAISSYSSQEPQRFRVDTANAYIMADGTALYQKLDSGWLLIKAYHPDLRNDTGVEGLVPMQYTVMEDTTAIADRAFARCNNLSAVVLPEGLCSIGDMAFWDCSKLTQIHIPASCTEVAPKAFFGIAVNFI